VRLREPRLEPRQGEQGCEADGKRCHRNEGKREPQPQAERPESPHSFAIL